MGVVEDVLTGKADLKKLKKELEKATVQTVYAP